MCALLLTRSASCARRRLWLTYFAITAELRLLTWAARAELAIGIVAAQALCLVAHVLGRSVDVRHPVETAMDGEIESLRRENGVLRSRLAQVTATSPLSSDAECLRWEAGPHTLTTDQIGRYSRQLLLPSFGVQGKPCSTASSRKHRSLVRLSPDVQHRSAC